jgi:hypothetical protein
MAIVILILFISTCAVFASLRVLIDITAYSFSLPKLGRKLIGLLGALWVGSLYLTSTVLLIELINFLRFGSIIILGILPLFLGTVLNVAFYHSQWRQIFTDAATYRQRQNSN